MNIMRPIIPMAAAPTRVENSSRVSSSGNPITALTRVETTMNLRSGEGLRGLVSAPLTRPNTSERKTTRADITVPRWSQRAMATASLNDRPKKKLPTKATTPSELTGSHSVVPWRNPNMMPIVTAAGHAP